MPPDFIAEQIARFLAGMFGGTGGGTKSAPVVAMDTKTRIVVLVPHGQHVLVEVHPATVEANNGS